MHEGLYKEWKDTETIRGIYSRLYENTEYFENGEDFVNSLEINKDLTSQIKTYII